MTKGTCSNPDCQGGCAVCMTEAEWIRLATKIDLDAALSAAIDDAHEGLKKQGWVAFEARDDIIRHALMEIAKTIIFGE